MFSIKFLVDDKRLAEVLRAIGDRGVYDLETIPVTNTITKGTKVLEKFSGTLKDRVAQQIAAKYEAGTKLNRGAIFQVVRELGGVPTSELITHLVKSKIVRHTDRNQYTCTGAK